MWQNESEEYPYSIGASACMVRYSNNFYIVTAKHALDRPKDMRTIGEAFIRQRFDSEWKIGLPLLSEITPVQGSQGNRNNCDIQICSIQLNPNDPVGIGDQDFIDVGDINDTRFATGSSFLIGFPSHAQNIDYENNTSFSEALIAQGSITDNHPDDGVLWFNSPTISNEDINGMSGGAVASYGEQGWRLEGICISGSGQNIFSRAGFVGRYYLLNQIKEFADLIVSINK